MANINPTDIEAALSRLSAPPATQSTTSNSRSLADEYKRLNKKHGKKVFQKVCGGAGSCDNLLCDHKYAPRGSKDAVVIPDPRILQLVMAKLEKEDFPVSEHYASVHLAKNENKLIPTINSIQKDILTREARLHNTGRISIPYERIAAYQMVEMYAAMKNVRKCWNADKRDTILDSFELEETALLSNDPNGWKMLFSLKHSGYDGKKEGEEHAKQMHAAEKKYREERGKAWKEVKSVKGLTDDEVEKCMEEWENKHAAPGTFGRPAGGIGSSYRRAYISAEDDPDAWGAEGTTFYASDDNEEDFSPALRSLEKKPIATATPVVKSGYQPMGTKMHGPEIDIKAKASNVVPKTVGSTILGKSMVPVILSTPNLSDGQSIPAVSPALAGDKLKLPQNDQKSTQHKETAPGIQNERRTTKKSVRQQVAELEKADQEARKALRKKETEQKMYNRLLKSLPTDAIPMASSLSVQAQDIEYTPPQQRIPLLPLGYKYDARVLAKMFLNTHEPPVVYTKKATEAPPNCVPIALHVPVEDAWKDAHVQTPDQRKGRPLVSPPVDLPRCTKLPSQATVKNVQAKTIDPNRAKALAYWNTPERYFRDWPERRPKTDVASPSIGPSHGTKGPLHATVEDAPEEVETRQQERARMLANLERHYKSKSDWEKSKAQTTNEDIISSIIGKYSLDTISPSKFTSNISAEPEAESDIDEFDSIVPLIERDTLFSKLSNVMQTFQGNVDLKEPSKYDILFVMLWGVRIRALAQTLIALCEGSAPLAAFFYKEFAHPEVKAAFLKHSNKPYKHPDLDHFAIDIEIFEWATRFLEEILSKKQMPVSAPEQPGAEGQ